MDGAEFSLFLVKKNLIDRTDEVFKTLLQWTDVDVFRRPLSFLFPADAHGRLEKLLDIEDARFDRVVFPRVPLRRKSGGYINFDMKIEQHEGDARRLDFYKPGRANGDGSDSAAPTDYHSFFNFVESLLKLPFDGDLELIMVSVEALHPDAKNGLSDSDKSAARADIEANLKGRAVGDQIGILDEASYGLITAGDFDEKAFEKELETVARKLKINPGLLSAKSAKVKIDDRDIDPKKLRQALNHSRGVFVGEIDEESELESLSNVLDGIEHNRRLIQDALKNYRFLTSPRIISDHVASVSVALLQQGKLNLERKIRRPDEIVVMNDHPDLSFQHDILQLDRLIRLRTHRSHSDRQKPDFYEVCRSTIVQDAFTSELQAIMEHHGEEPGLVGLRVKGLPPVKQGGAHWAALKKLSAMGHPLWIDRFGDAVVETGALDFLRDGFVEMPIKMMRTLADHFDGKDLMTQLVKTWQKLNVRVVSADLPTHELKYLAHDLGINFGVEDPPDALIETG